MHEVLEPEQTGRTITRSPCYCLIYSALGRWDMLTLSVYREPVPKDPGEKASYVREARWGEHGRRSTTWRRREEGARNTLEK